MHTYLHHFLRCRCTVPNAAGALAAAAPTTKEAATQREPSIGATEQGGMTCCGPDRRYNMTLIVLAVLLVVIAAIALPLWLVPPSATGQYIHIATLPLTLHKKVTQIIVHSFHFMLFVEAAIKNTTEIK